MDAAPPRSRPRVVVPLISRRTYIDADLEVLREEFEVLTPWCRPWWRIPSALAAVVRADLLFCWFGSHRFLPLALVARALGKRVVIVAGGYDTANVPEIGYGNMRPGLRRFLGRALVGLADLVLFISRSAAAEARAAGVPLARTHVLHLGVPPVPVPASKDSFVLTVSDVDATTLTRRGLSDVAHIARRLPQVKFVLVGRPSKDPAVTRFLNDCPPNLDIRGHLSSQELTELYSRAAVYLQPSRHEAFGVSVAEAMAHGCLPIVGNRYALPEIVGDCGKLVDPGDHELACKLITEALARPEPSSQAAARIGAHFSPERRRDLLLSHVRALLR